MGSLELTDRNYKLTFKLDQAIDPRIEMKEFLIKVIDPQLSYWKMSRFGEERCNKERVLRWLIFAFLGSTKGLRCESTYRSKGCAMYDLLVYELATPVKSYMYSGFE